MGIEERNSNFYGQTSKIYLMIMKIMTSMKTTSHEGTFSQIIHGNAALLCILMISRVPGLLE